MTLQSEYKNRVIRENVNKMGSCHASNKSLTKSIDEPNFESFYLLWLDTDVNQFQKNISAQQRFRTIINYLQIFDDNQECEQYIRDISHEDRIVFIVNDRIAQDMISRIHPLRQISSIYIHRSNMMKDDDDEWINKFSKIKAVMNNFDELLDRIQTDQTRRRRNEEPISISIFRSNYTNNDNDRFLYAQLLIDVLRHMESMSTDRTDFISFCRQQYKGNKNELIFLREFQSNYSSDQALQWYTRELFLYRLLSKALRKENIDLLFFCRFFIRDIEQQLEQYQCSSHIHVYRSQLMSNDELKILKDSIGHFIGINSFLSTGVDRELALAYLNGLKLSSEDDLQRVLFEIDADPRLTNIKPFANISSCSYFDDEQEVLFMVGSIFRLVDIHLGNDQVWIIQMTLSSTNDRNLKLFFDQMKNVHDDNISLLAFGKILQKMDKLDEAGKFYLRLIDELPDDDERLVVCFHNLGNLAFSKGDYDSSLEWLLKSLETSMRTVQPDEHVLAPIYSSIACVYDAKDDFKWALESYNNALAIWQRRYGDDHPKIAECWHNIGIIYKKEKKYSKALESYQKALTIHQNHFPTDDHELVMLHNSIGGIHRILGNFHLALEHYNTSLDILQKSLSPQHSKIAKIYENIGQVYSTKGDLKQALSYYEKAATIYRRPSLSTQSNNVKIEELIRNLASHPPSSFQSQRRSSSLGSIPEKHLSY